MGGNGHFLSAALQLPFKAWRKGRAFSVLPLSDFYLRVPVPPGAIFVVATQVRVGVGGGAVARSATNRKKNVKTPMGADEFSLLLAEAAYEEPQFESFWAF